MINAFEKEIDEWFTVEGVTVANAATRLWVRGCNVSPANLSVWWEKRSRFRCGCSVVDTVKASASGSREIEGHPAINPELAVAMLVNLMPFAGFDGNSHAKSELKRFAMAAALLKPVLGWAGVQERRKMRKLAEKKYRDVVAEKRDLKKPKGPGGVSPENLSRAEEALHLL